MPSLLSCAFALLVCVPLCVLMAWMEARSDTPGIDVRPKREPEQTTWPRERIEA